MSIGRRLFSAEGEEEKLKKNPDLLSSVFISHDYYDSDLPVFHPSYYEFVSPPSKLKW